MSTTSNKTLFAFSAVSGIFAGLLSFAVVFAGAVFSVWTHPAVFASSYIVSGLPFFIYGLRSRRALWSFPMLGAFTTALLSALLLGPRFGVIAFLVTIVAPISGTFTARFYASRSKPIPRDNA